MTAPTAGDFDYETHGGGYALRRRTDPRIAAFVHAALGDACTVVNVGAGAGSYEPLGRCVVAVEPSARMRAQRLAGQAQVVAAVAEALPFADGAFAAAMATNTVHQWADLERGLGELRRVSRGPVVLLTFDGDAFDRNWLVEYVPELVAYEQRRMPSIGRIVAALGGTTVVTPVPVPADCCDGFIEAFLGRPECFLDPMIRRAQSPWVFVGPEIVARGVAQLRADLVSGAWDRRHAALRLQNEFTGALRLITAYPASTPARP
ncbi:methyltransferase domain-containing protein [Frankia sp. AgB1.9]|uniref:methyltransferase domain-containing protein n=1 Tax=unclassified Frankia TaxID=2632575 RepID=UPI0019336CC3|nr:MULTISPECIES: methyltransferase domain-containing protein [unclassified Frankia]MBL7493422.1 methyltransferase domain-containing protein [Frankia sp. AgW1.1]MBL7549059.1 methyltransferase domain-containing protein [Frankia sp. AgB1.9]MBL7624296.1 methyltransferase domain-containing protein [Frankia sp. AgB1.8]